MRSVRYSRAAARSLAAALALALAPPLAALQLQLGELNGSFDTTLSFGASYRLQNPDPDLYGIASGGTQHSVNVDDGNLNYRRGFYSIAAKGTHDLQLNYHNLRFFARGTYLYDEENEHDERARTPLSEEAREKVARYADFLDYFVAANFDVGGRPLDVRLGSQVLSWGESTFIQNGINVINPIDVARLRVPGAELREALVPVQMISGSFGLTDNVTLEAFYQFRFEETAIDPSGTYFSSNDFASPGGERVYLGFGAIPDNSPFGFVSRGADRWASDSGQWGLAARVLLPSFTNAELGLYFINYHSRLPLISAITPTRAISATEVQTTAGSLAQQNLAPAMIAAGFPASQVPAALTTLVGAALTNVPVGGLPANLQPFYPAAQSIANSARQLGFFSAAATGQYVVEYPEDIKLYGISFNTDVGATGISLQGELSYKVGVPLQVDDVELLFAALSSINPAFAPPNNQLGSYVGQLNTRVAGYKRKDVWQAQFTGTKVFGPRFGAGQWVLLGEVGATHAPHLPAQDVLRFDGAGTFTSGSAAAMTGSGNGAFPATPANLFADDFSWGYQIAARFDYSDVFWGLNASPSLAFSHDVQGNTPLPLGNFVEGRKSITAAAEFTYLNAWAFELRYVNYFGAGRANLISDRDFVSATAKYSF